MLKRQLRNNEVRPQLFCDGGTQSPNSLSAYIDKCASDACARRGCGHPRLSVSQPSGLSLGPTTGRQSAGFGVCKDQRERIKLAETDCTCALTRRGSPLLLLSIRDAYLEQLDVRPPTPETLALPRADGHTRASPPPPP